MSPEDLIALLVQLVGDPSDLDARRRAAVALDRRGDRASAQRLLIPLVNLTGHEEAPPLPCLCKTCEAAAGQGASAGGVSFRRAFVIEQARVLHFWLPEELAEERVEVDRAVAEAMRRNLSRRRKRSAS